MCKAIQSPKVSHERIGNKEDSEIQEITETENARDMEGRQEKEPHVIPYIKGIKMMSEREATECAENGEVLRWSTDSEPEQTIDKPNQTTPESDTTGSTPEIFKSPEIIQGRVPGSDSVSLVGVTLVEETVGQNKEVARQYRGVRHVKETELQESSSDSDDNIPVASLIKQKTATSLTIEQMQDLKEGPKGEKAVGVTITKLFDGVEFRGKVDSFRQVR